MVKVKNVKVSEIPFETADKNFQRCVEYIKSVTPDGAYKKYMPKKPKQKLSFELIDANSDLANTIRRFLLDEIPVQSMTVSEENIKTTDRFILTDYLKKQIELVPILQGIDMTELKISLSIENNTDKRMPIYTRDMKITDKSGKKLDNAKYFSETIIFSRKSTYR